MKAKIDIVDTDSDRRTEIVDIAAGGATVKETAELAGLDIKDKDFSVNGNPATLDTPITPADILSAQQGGKAVLTVSARPQGS